MSRPRRLSLVLATTNPGKVQEIRELMRGIELLARPLGFPDIEENGETLTDNARLKAIALVDATGCPALADDTGLEVDALDGQPGVHSARYAGEQANPVDNIAKLLHALKDVPNPARTARFRTVGLLYFPDGSEIVAEGVAEGTISTATRGENGFGYDPVFVLLGDGRTFGELSMVEKLKYSHRGQAFRALRQQLAQLVQVGD